MRRRDFIGALGASVGWSLTARAQQRAVPVIGYLTGGPVMVHLAAAFRQGLSELGFVEGRNIEILNRSAEGRYDRLPSLVHELVRRKVAIIVATEGSATPNAAKSATASIPIVFTTGADPVELGLVASLNRPGGNVTGVTFLVHELLAKKIELLHEIVPTAISMGILTNPSGTQVEAEKREAQMAARAFGLNLLFLDASTTTEIQQVFASLAGRQIGALVQGNDALFAFNGEQIAGLAARFAIPTIYAERETVEAGGLVSYGGSEADAWRLAGSYVGRILKGEKPADLPVQQSTRIEMVLNLKTAKALGIEVPTATLLRATEVIE